MGMSHVLLYASDAHFYPNPIKDRLCVMMRGLQGTQIPMVRAMLAYVLGLPSPEIERLEEEHSALVGFHWCAASLLDI